ncbi:ATP-grasp fold amidoligase family protein [Roseomonas sp. CECT 9278]|uniref:ATP-grasp fold amidoligase family protein n=1 Tax=Roseomonas sp. CECT 9278 TaxID=2845823 RepID=UPI001E42530D|nr:ATP-grasp fold amidoligase family protein [Roseomonas sp. CECT 9278]CAH0294037.1 hypothetical protein ROS9278_04318 [Roseomonas sp. CECT 9278]
MNRDTLFDWIDRQGLSEEDGALARLLVRRFRRDFGVWPALAPPRFYVEWLLHRMIFDRDPRLPVIVDKVAMRDHARRVLGHDPTVPLLQVHATAGALDWGRLPAACILKASHGSGWNIALRDTAGADRAAVTARMDAWLGRDMWRERMEWAYAGVPPRVIAEPLLRQPGSRRPDDICIYCFGGVPQYIRVNRYPAGAPDASGCLDAALRPLALYAEPATTGFPAGIDPAPLLEMARRLSAGFVYLRVDFLAAAGRAWLCELTVYPGGGRSTNYRDDAAELLVGRLYAAAQRGAPPPFMLDGREHFTGPAVPGGLTLRPAQA